MSSLTVTKDIDGNTGLTTLKIDDILFFEYDGRTDRIIVQLKDETYYTVGTLRYWNKVLNNSGYKFKLVDRNNMVNMNKIKMLDKIFKVAYFETDISSRSKRCTVSSSNYKELEKELGMINPQLGWT
ncbi:DNA-binding LytR/AlgR family response regulator [Paenibacillus sp. DS2015]|uniref:LytTR family DNA-binding domain-containing protein n=1 Tax=Paenibacillus sp. DS2015 TaxID=3373917 RepID=UPI003D21C595